MLPTRKSTSQFRTGLWCCLCDYDSIIWQRVDGVVVKQNIKRSSRPRNKPGG